MEETTADPDDTQRIAAADIEDWTPEALQRLADMVLRPPSESLQREQMTPVWLLLDQARAALDVLDGYCNDRDMDMDCGEPFPTSWPVALRVLGRDLQSIGEQLTAAADVFETPTSEKAAK